MKRIEKATDYKYMAAMMLEVELNQSWNRSKGFKRYIHLIKYAEGEDYADDTWNGSVRAVQDLVLQTNQRIDKLNTQMEMLVKQVTDNNNKNWLYSITIVTAVAKT